MHPLGPLRFLEDGIVFAFIEVLTETQAISFKRKPAGGIPMLHDPAIRRIYLLLTTISALLSACAFIVEDEPPHNDRITHLEVHEFPVTRDYQLRPCDPNSPYYRPDLSFCAGQANSGPGGSDHSQMAWQTNCRADACSSLAVYVHYLLEKDLGPHQIVWVEAFNNPYFQGAPAASLYIGGFDSSQASSSQRELLFLKPGEYYLRAYIHSGMEPPLPLVMQGMQLVSSRPLGVYGALSSPQRVLVQKQETRTVHIEIDQLLEDPDQPVDTKARLRIKFNVDPNAYIEADRKILIQLLGTADIEASPRHLFELSSNALLISGREFQAEFVSPSLPVQEAFVFAFLDENANGFYDFGELAQMYQQSDEFLPVKIREDRILTVTLPLLLTPNLP